MKKLHLLAGLPRSGTTVLAALLNQNPKIYTPTTSSFVELLWRNYSLWDDPIEKSSLEISHMKSLKKEYLKDVGNNWFSKLTDKEVVIDKRRIWHSIPNIKMYKEIYGVKPKIICTVRDVAEIVVSFMKVFENNDELFIHNTSLEGEMFGVVYDKLKETFFDSYFTECIHLVEYNDLVDKPQETLDKIYTFLELPSYKHSFSNIQSIEKEGKYKGLSGNVFEGLHDIKSVLEKNKTPLSKYLTEHEIYAYNDKIFWKHNG